MCTDCNVNTELVLSLHVCVLSRVWLFAIPWTIAHQAPLFMGFSRQEHWRALPFLSVAFLHCRFFAFWITREAYPVIHFPNCTDVWSHLTQGSMGTLCTFSISMNFSLQCEPSSHWALLSTERGSARFGSTYTKIGMVQKRLAWPLCKDDMQIHEVFHIKKRKKDRKSCWKSLCCGCLPAGNIPVQTLVPLSNFHSSGFVPQGDHLLVMLHVNCV